jgi:MFS family permease
MLQPRGAPPSFDASPAYSRYVLALLFLVAVFALVDRQILGILSEALKREFGVSDTTFGLAAGPAFAVFYALAVLPIAQLADRGARRSVIAAGLLAWSALTFLTGFAASFLQLVALRFAIGVGEACSTPPAHALISDYFPPRRRAGALSVYTAGASTGIVLSYLAGGWLLEHYGWRAVFFALGAPGVALALLVLMTVRDASRGRFDAAPARDVALGAALREMLAWRTYRHLLAAFSLHSLSFMAAATWNPAFLARVHAMQPAEIGVWLGLGSALFTALGALSAGTLTNRTIARDARFALWWPGLASFVAAPLTIAFLFAPSRGLALACLAPSAFLFGFGTPGMHAVTQSLARPATRATAAALNLLSLTIVGSLGPFGVGWVNDRLAGVFGEQSVRWSLALAALILVWSGAHNFLAARTLREDAARAGRG